MKASALEFRLRMAINTVIICLGFWSPWIEAWGIGQRIPSLEWLALELSRFGLLRFTVAAPAVIVVAALIAALGAMLRVWGSACLGPAIVQHGKMHAGAVTAAGPYRYVRNPLYLGLWFMTAALAFLMPPTGAIFAMTALTVFLLRLILAEEDFLTVQLGEPYQAYLRTTPRLFPRIRTSLPQAGGKPRWLRAAISETIPIGVFLTLAVFSWTFNNRLMIRVILISFGASMVARALLPGIKQESGLPE